MQRRSIRSWSRFAVTAALLIPVLGCGEEFEIVPVSGVVTVDGEPVEGVHLSFQPFKEDGSDTAGYGAYGETDAQGRFELTSIGPEGRDIPGAVIGKHRIEMTAARQVDPESDLNQFSREKIPRHYLNKPWVKEVDGETDALNFELSSRPGR